MSHYTVLMLMGDHPIMSFFILLLIVEGIECWIKEWRGGSHD